MEENLSLLSDLVSLAESIQNSRGNGRQGVWDDLVAILQGVIQDIIDLASTGINNVTNGAKTWLYGKINDARDAITAFVSTTKTSISGYITTAQDNITDFITTTKDNIIGGITTVVKDIKTGVENIVTGIKNAILDGVYGARDAISGFITNAKTAITAKIDTVSTWISNAKDVVVEKIETTLSGLGEAFLEGMGWIKDKIDGLITAIGDIGENIGTAIADAIGNVGDWLGGIVSTIVDSASQWLKTNIDNFKTSIGELATTIKNSITGFIDNAKDWIAETYNNVKTYIANAIDMLKVGIQAFKENIEDKLQKLYDWIDEVKGQIVTWFWSTASSIASWFANEVMPKFANVIEGATALVDLGKMLWGMINDGNYQGAFDVIDKFISGLGIPAPIQGIYAIVSTIAYFWQSVQLQFVPMQIAAAKNANISLAMEPIALEALASSVFRGKATIEEYYENARLAGVTKDRAIIALESSKALMTPGAVQISFLRGDITEQQHDEKLASYGYSQDDINLFKAMYFFIPTPNDLVRMAVREVFTPETVEYFGQNEDFPETFANWAEKQGMSRDWALAYWAAHWELPSPQMGFEMLHRGIIDDDELKLLMKSLDVMPFWREKLIQLSYSPLTRVDIRRMYQVGVIDESQVLRSYLDIGYSPEKAEWLVEFTKRYSAPEDETDLDQYKKLARTTYSQAYKRKIISKDEYKTFLLDSGLHPDDCDLLISIDDFTIMQNDKLFDLDSYRKDWKNTILKAYEIGLISAQEIFDMLIDLGYDEKEVVLEVNLIDYNRSLMVRSILLKQLSEQYITYIADDTTVHNILNMFGFRVDEITNIMEEWNIERSYRTKKPTLADIKKFYEAKLISLDELLDEIRGLGYAEKYIGMYRQLITNIGVD